VYLCTTYAAWSAPLKKNTPESSDSEVFLDAMMRCIIFGLGMKTPCDKCL